MPQITPTSRNSFDSLIATIRKADRDVQECLKQAVKQNYPVEDLVSLVQASVKLSDELQRISDLELDYMASEIGVSDAEEDLALGAQDARAHTKSMKTVAEFVDGAEKVTSVITKLLQRF